MITMLEIRYQRKVKQLIRLLKEAANVADTLEVTLGNGAEVGSIIGGIATELEMNLLKEMK